MICKFIKPTFISDEKRKIFINSVIIVLAVAIYTLRFIRCFRLQTD